MKVYKYRGVANLDRDIKGLVEDYFFAPTAEVLNDPTEVVLNDRLVTALAKGLSAELSAALEQLTSLRHSVGIYSLSRTATDELMWAHYSESHAGFCIEYDLERLVLDARTQWSTLDVIYSAEPPIMTIADVLGRSGTADAAIAKLVGNKSLRWSYENELRIITARAGISHYARAAVTGIYFGCRCSEATERKLRVALKDRAHRYAKMTYPALSYQLKSTDLPRCDLDGTPAVHMAPVEESAVVTLEDLGEYAALYSAVLAAVDVVRRDPSCIKVINADVSRSGPRRGTVFVQYETSVDVPGLCNIAKQYFESAPQS